VRKKIFGCKHSETEVAAQKLFAAAKAERKK